MKAYRAFLKSILLAVLSMIWMSPARSQCSAPTLSFNSPQLISGTDGTAGAVYRFPSVIPGVDALVTIMGLYGGASLAEIDNTTGAGYYDAFQPYVWAGANDTSYIDWKIAFVQEGTFIDTTLACLAVTAIDVDGDNVQLKEFVEAATPGSFGVDPFSVLSVSFDGVKSKAIGQITTIPLIDTNHREAMFQMNFTNIHQLLYRNGAITTGGSQVRQTCIYFKPFFQEYILLPVRMQSFSLNMLGEGNQLSWVTSEEQQLKLYTLQKSTDGSQWKDINNQWPQYGNTTNRYSYIDREQLNVGSWYRIKQTDQKNRITYSKIIFAPAAEKVSRGIIHNSVINDQLNVQVETERPASCQISIVDASGKVVSSQIKNLSAGTHRFSIPVSASLPKGLYLLSVRNNNEQSAYTGKLIKM